MGVPEIWRPWFSEKHNFIDKPFFGTASNCGLVSATDEYR